MTNQEIIYIRCSVRTNKQGSKCVDVYEYPKSDWDALSDDGKTSILNVFMTDHLSEYVDSWRVAEDANGNEISGDL